MKNKKTSELALKIEQKLCERGQSENRISQYHYIFSVFSTYSEKHNDGNFSKELLEKCLVEHYNIADIDKILSRDDHYKKIAIRAYRLLCERYNESPFTDRFFKPKPEMQSNVFNKVANEFYKHHIKNGYSELTSKAYYRCACQLLSFAESNGVYDLDLINTVLLNKYTLTLINYRNTTIKGILGTLRIFLRYLYTEGNIAENPYDTITVLRVRDQIRIPSVWHRDDVLKLLSVIDRGNPSGKRDYAMILLVARLGIRIGDLSSLKFENIDWRNNKIDFKQSKTGHVISLPLLNDVGWALIDYIKNGRPKIDSPYLFLTHVAPIKEFSGDNHHHKMIEKYMAWAHIPIYGKRRLGMHSLRHTLATIMLENHENLHDISAALGHRSEDSASVYLKTSIELLRECALVPPEVSR